MPPKCKKARLDGASSGSSTNNPSSGCIRFEVNISEISPYTRKFSPEIDVMEMPWNLCVVNVNGASTTLGVYLHRRASDCDLWKVDVSTDITLISAHTGKNMTRKFATTYSSERASYGFPQFCTWLEIFDEERGFLKDGKIIIEARFTLSNFKGISVHPVIDFTDGNDPRHDIALVIGGEKIHVSKQVLAVHSPVFNAMFFGQFAEKNKKEIELKDIDRMEFIEMLNMIYPSYQKITDDNAESLLSLADRFQIKSITDQVEQFYISSRMLNVANKLLLSDQHRLVKLQDYCLYSLTTAKAITDLNKTEAYKSYSKNLKGTLMDKIAKLSH